MNDDRTLAEKMNQGLGLDPGFTLDRPGLTDELEEEIDDTVARSKRAHAQPDHPKDE
jgi:hypothetical protein